MKSRGFTLLEVLVASLIMAIAVTGLLSALSTSLRTASRLTDYDRAVLLARQKMNELLVDNKAYGTLQGTWPPQVTGNLQAGWRAQISPFEVPVGANPTTAVLERVQLEVWWMSGERRRTFALDGFRRALLASEQGP